MTYSPYSSPPPAPSNAQYEVYTQNGPMALGEGLFITEDGKIEVDAQNIPGTINCGQF